MKGAPEGVRARALKLATGEVVSACGGIEASASIINKGKSQVHRCTSINDADNFMGVRDVAQLEAYSGTQPVTRLLCKLAGGAFLQLPDPALCDDDTLPLQVIGLADELGDVSHAVRDALRDGEVNRAELKEIEQQLDELVDKAIETRAMVQVMLGVEPVVRPIGNAKRGGD